MKKNFGIALFALAGVLATGCAADDDGEAVLPGEPVRQQSMDAVDLTLNPGWEWKRSNVEEVYVIRSQEELLAFVEGGTGLPAEVDFTHYAIVYATGGASHGIERIDKSFTREGAGYVFAVDLVLNETMEAPRWNQALTVAQLPADAQVELRVSVRNSREEPIGLSDLALNPGWSWRMEETNTLYVIRSAEELAAHVTGGEGTPADVDFSRYTVLFASGRATNGIEEIRKSFGRTEEGYLMSVVLYLNLTEEAPLWNAAVLVPVLPVGSHVELQVNPYGGLPEIEQCGSGLHIEVDDLVLKSGWNWRIDEATALYIIRSDVELLSHLQPRKTNQRPADIDFTKNAVLFVPGVSSSNVARLERTLYVGTRGFRLGIEVYQGMLTVIENWQVAVVVPIAVANSSLSYNVETKWNH